MHSKYVGKHGRDLQYFKIPSSGSRIDFKRRDQLIQVPCRTRTTNWKTVKRERAKRSGIS